MDINPPFWQDIACRSSKFSPHAQTSGSPLTIQPYLKAKASVNFCLLSEKPFALIGKADSQFEAPVSCANVSFRFIWSDKLGKISFRQFSWVIHLSFDILLLISLMFCSSTAFHCSCVIIISARADVTFRELLYSWSALVTGFGIPSPPSLGGNVRISLSSSLHVCPFVMAGIKEYLIQFSSGPISSPISAIVLNR